SATISTHAASGNAGDITLTADAITLGGDLLATSARGHGGDIRVDGAAQLLHGVKVDARGTSGNGAVEFHGTVDAAGAPVALDVWAATARFERSLGGTRALGAVTIMAGDGVVLGSGAPLVIATHDA